MKLLKTLTVLLTVLVPNVLALKCHRCTSTKSWVECENADRLSTEDCAQKDAVCYKTHYATNDGTFNQYAKSCGPQSYCKKETNPICKGHLGSSKCDIHCCDENLCNAGSIVCTSAIFMAAGIFVVMLLVTS